MEKVISLSQLYYSILLFFNSYYHNDVSSIEIIQNGNPKTFKLLICDYTHRQYNVQSRTIRYKPCYELLIEI